MRATPKDIELNKLYYKKADGIIISTQKMIERFREEYGLQYEDIIYRAYFGVNGFNYIYNFVGKRDICVLELGLPINKNIITVGYNACKEQQHDKALKCISSLPQKIKDNIHIVLKMTYLREDEEYISYVESILSTVGCSFTIYKDYLSDDESAKLTVATDVFIHSQISDALSASIQENLYGGSLVLNPSWIKYKELEDIGAFYITYDDFDDLRRHLENILTCDYKNLYKNKLLNNQNVVPDHYSWKSVSKQWFEIYKKVFDK